MRRSRGGRRKFPISDSKLKAVMADALEFRSPDMLVVPMATQPESIFLCDGCSLWLIEDYATHLPKTTEFIAKHKWPDFNKDRHDMFKNIWDKAEASRKPATFTHFAHVQPETREEVCWIFESLGTYIAVHDKYINIANYIDCEYHIGWLNNHTPLLCFVFHNPHKDKDEMLGLVLPVRLMVTEVPNIKAVPVAEYLGFDETWHRPKGEVANGKEATPAIQAGSAEGTEAEAPR